VNHQPESRLRENRMSGSEGGETEPNRSFLPLSPSRSGATRGAMNGARYARLANQSHSPSGTRPLGCAPASASNQRGERSPSRFGLNLVTESNCVLMRGGGKQLEVNDQSVG
jgi:hypothetical protein